MHFEHNICSMDISYFSIFFYCLSSKGLSGSDMALTKNVRFF